MQQVRNVIAVGRWEGVVLVSGADEAGDGAQGAEKWVAKGTP